MKRIKSACLCQTIHFRLKEDVDQELAVREVQAEYDAYIHQLERKRIPYHLVSRETQPDGSILVRILRQYNTYPTGEYLK